MAKGQKFTSDSPSIEEIMRLKTKHTTSIDLIVNPEINAEIQILRRQHIVALSKDNKENRTPLAPAIMKEIERLEEEALAFTATFTFQDLGRKVFEDLWGTCPPSDEQKELGYEWDPDAFGPVILSAASLEPKITEKDAQTIYDEWSTSEAEMLVMTAINANMGATSIPLSVTGTGDPASSGLNLITAQIEESPTPTS